MSSAVSAKPWSRGGVVGLSLGKYTWAGGGVALLVTSLSLAAPTGEKVVQGSAQFTRQGNLTKITAADKTVINYSSFNINRNETVRFIQPSATSKVLNRITSSDPTKINGTLQANGIVYIVNPAGVYFGNGALVNVGGIYAAAGNISNKDFTRGINNFTNVKGSVVNDGRITVTNGGVAALVGDRVANSGSITVDQGVIAMVSGNDVVLGERGGVMSVRVNKEDPNSKPQTGSVGVLNTGRLDAKGGATRMVAGDMYALAVRNTGTVRAAEIKVEGQGQGNVSVSGTLNARNGREGGFGGVVEVTGNKVAVVDATIDASGRNGGGRVNIGGGLRGSGDLKTSQLTVVQDSTIKADAVKRGDGGQVIVYSDQHTSFSAQASAKGGADVGNGGVIETSGKQTVDIRGADVDASAVKGKGGTWLMDPFNVTIDQVGSSTGGTFSGGDPDTFTPSATATVDVDDINSALNNGTSVEIITGSSGSDAGDISLTGGAAISKTAGADATLTLRAANDININGTIGSSSGKLNVNLLANNNAGGNVDTNTAAGSVNMGVVGAIGTNGGNIVAEGVNLTMLAGATMNAGTGDVTLRPTSASSTIGIGAGAAGAFNVSAAELGAITSSGTITIGRSGGTGAVDLNALNLTVGGPSLTVEGGSISTESITLANGEVLSLAANTGAIDESGATTFTVQDGSIFLRANDVTFEGNTVINAGATGSVSFVPNATRTVGVGAAGMQDFAISQAEVDDITAGTINIGAADSGDMTVGAINATGLAGNVALTSGGAIIAQAQPSNVTALTSVSLTAVGAIGSSGQRLLVDAPQVNATTTGMGATAFLRIVELAPTVTLNTSGDADVIGNGDLTFAGTVGGALTAVAGGPISATGFNVDGNATLTSIGVGNAITLNNSTVGGSVGFFTAANGDVVMTSSQGIDLASSMIGRDLTLTSDGSITDSGPISVGGVTDLETRNDAGAAIILDAANSFADFVSARSRNAADTATSAGAIEIRDTDGFLAVGNSETTGTATLRSNDLDILGTLKAGDVNLLPVSPGTTIAVNDSAGTMSIDTTDLQNIDCAGTVTIGLAASGAIHVGSLSAIDLSTESYSLTLRGGDVTFTNGMTLADNTRMTIDSTGAVDGSNMAADVTIGGMTGELSVTAAGQVDLDTAVARFAASDSAGGVTIRQTGALSIQVIGSVTGVSAAGDVDIIGDAKISVDAPISTSGTANIFITANGADAGDICVNNSVTADDGNVTLRADNDVMIGSTGLLKVASGSGSITVTADDDTTNTGGAGTGGDVTFADGAMISTPGNAVITADGEIDDLGDPVTIDPTISAAQVTLTSANGTIGATSAIDTATAAITASAPGGVNLTNTGALIASLNSTSGIVAIMTDGTLGMSAAWAADEFDVTAQGAVDVSEDITSDNGNVSIVSKTGGITVQSGRTISSGGSNILLSAADLDLIGNLDAGAGDISIGNSNAGTIGVGDATGAMTITGAELSRMTGDELAIGGANTTGITVDGVAESDVMNLNKVTLDATRDDATITFSGSASVFEALMAMADDGITVGVDLSATQGDLILDGDADNAADTTDRLSIASGVTLSTEPMGGDVSLRATTGGIVADGSLVVNANQDIILGSNVTTPGALTLNAGGQIILEAAQSGQILMIDAADGLNINGDITNTASAAILNADSDADGMGTLSLATGKTINTGNNDLTITAADLALDGSITSGMGTVSIRRATMGTIGLGSASGDMQISGDELQRITANTLRIGNSLTTQINAADVTAPNTANIASLIELIADNMDITGVLNTSNADLTITRANTGTIGIGSSAGDLYLSGAELAFITTNELLLGGGQTTNINVGAVSGAQSMGIESLRLESTGRITFSAGSSTFRALSAIASDGITINSNVTTTDGDMLLEANSDNDADPMDNIAVSDGRILSSGGLLTLDATSGGIDAAGEITLNAKSNITINDTLSANGPITLNADSDGSGLGQVIIPASVTVLSSGNPIAIKGSNLTLNGNINAGAGSVTIDRGNVGAITVGVGSQGMTISGAELSRIIATGITIGGANTRTIEVNGVTAANSNSITGVTRLEAGADQGQVVFNGSASTFNTLEVAADNVIAVNTALNTDVGGITMDADLDNASDGQDRVLLGANLTVPTGQDVTFDSGVALRKNVTVTGNDVVFNGTVDSETGRRGLTVISNGSGITAFNAAVGAIKPLLGLNTNADGVTRLGANINTDTGDIIFRDAVRLTGNVRVRATGGGEVGFNSTVDSHGATNRNLTVVVDTDTSPTANSIPVISFAGDVGSTFALGNIFLNYDPSSSVDGHTAPPRVASIIARSRNTNGQVVNNPSANFAFNASGSFRMGRNEKLTSGGNLSINAASATLGDLTTIGNMSVTAPSITLLRRDAGQILGTMNELANDMGVDYVSGGNIAFSVIPVAAGPGPEPTFATQTGSGDVNSTLSGFIFRAFGEILPTDINLGTTSIRTLDLKSDGPTNTNFADAIAGAIPRETRQNDVGQETAIGQAQMEDLKNLGIVPRNPTTEELLDFLIGRTVYNDMPRKNVPGADDYTTVVNRLPGERVTALLRSYDKVFNTDLTDDAGTVVVDPATGKPKRVSKADDIKATLLASVRRYRAENPGVNGEVDPLQFRAFVDNSPEDAQSSQYLDQLGEFLDQLESLGLTPRELQTSKNIMLKDVRPAGIGRVSTFEDVIRNRPRSSGEALSMR